ncbi:hypothetical protein PEDI_32770 [Persicobacter diffluens]|uniref:Uncharacterized protein n=1 Tax=Persicobacter diffluens TaxID=981 RepID=A0AAN5AKC8_9BACT|nr:hypothetical protein PEDI_32770 [Persicobacter diffluens]
MTTTGLRLPSKSQNPESVRSLLFTIFSKIFYKVYYYNRKWRGSIREIVRNFLLVSFGVCEADAPKQMGRSNMQRPVFVLSFDDAFYLVDSVGKYHHWS